MHQGCAPPPVSPPACCLPPPTPPGAAFGAIKWRPRAPCPHLQLLCAPPTALPAALGGQRHILGGAAGPAGPLLVPPSTPSLCWEPQLGQGYGGTAPPFTPSPSQFTPSLSQPPPSSGRPPGSQPRHSSCGSGVLGVLFDPRGCKALRTQPRRRSLLGLLLLGEGFDDLLLLGLQALLAALPSLLGLGPASLGLVAARKEDAEGGKPQRAPRRPLALAPSPL